MFHNNIVKISENFEQVEVVAKLAAVYLPYRFFAKYAAIFTIEK